MKSLIILFTFLFSSSLFSSSTHSEKWEEAIKFCDKKYEGYLSNLKSDKQNAHKLYLSNGGEISIDEYDDVYICTKFYVTFSKEILSNDFEFVQLINSTYKIIIDFNEKGPFSREATYTSRGGGLEVEEVERLRKIVN